MQGCSMLFYFFKALGAKTAGSPRPEPEDAMAPVLRPDDPMDCTEWTRKRPFATEASGFNRTVEQK